jgi:hypothetical protein
MTRYLLLAVVLCAGCAKNTPPLPTYTVKAVGDCTEGTGGWGGDPAKCRVTLSDDTRATVVRPVDVGYSVRCYAFGCYVVRG